MSCSNERVSNNDGSVGGSNAYPITFEPRSFNQSDNHDPWNPVCPVTRTVLFLKNPLN